MNHPVDLHVFPAHVSRRTFFGAASAAAASAATVQAATRPAAGLFSGAGRLRVGVIGCGGRGTGAAVQAAAAAHDVTITALGDLFADQLAESAGLLERVVSQQFDCPAERRFSGIDAWRQVLASDVDLVILAAPPATRSVQFAAAIRAGKHVYCEKPAAIDARGLADVLAACAEARGRGLSIGAGLCLRHDEETRSIVGRIHDGAIGDVRHVAVHASIGLPWQRPRLPGWSHAEWRLRNWVVDSQLSGGSFVEHHIHAVDKALWTMGDACPVVALPCAVVEPVGGVGTSGTSVVYRFADGGTVAASLDRRTGNGSRIEEVAVGSRGAANLRASTPGRPSPHAAAMQALVAAVVAGDRRDDMASLCRSTQVAIMGRMAAETGRAIRWQDVLGPLA
ncbi:MAG: Gfo/Idh/MocA family oxidoreductase [Pirellulales bacterium]